MSNERDEIRRQRKELRARYGALFSEVEQILFKHDPMEIAFSDSAIVAENSDEYAPEVGTILPRLNKAGSVSDVTDIVYEEFQVWFGDELEMIGPKAAYQSIAADIWAAWTRYKAG